MEYIDNRGRRTVFVGNCILNQNVRAPGVAVQSGAFRDFVHILLRNGIGIEQFPCPECLVWGGIRRNDLYQWQPLCSIHSESGGFPSSNSSLKPLPS